MKYPFVNRRQFLIGTAGAAAGLAMTSCSSVSQLTRAPRGFKLAVCDWTIGKRADPASLEAAKSLGLDGVQVDFGGGQENLPLCNPDLQKRFLEQAKKQQIEIASLAMGVLNEVPYKSDVRAERWVSEAIDVAKAMDVKVILLAFFGNGDVKNDKKGIDTVITRLKKVAPKAQKAGVILGVESWLSAEQHLDIIDGERLVEFAQEQGGLGRELLSCFLESKWKDRLALGLPDDIEFANKTGTLPGVVNDVGIVIGDNMTYVLAVMSKDVGATENGQRTMKMASLAVYKHLSQRVQEGGLTATAIGKQILERMDY